MATEAQTVANRRNAQKSTSTRFLSMSLGNPADCFMQNKPNLLEGKIDAKCVFTKDYENKWQRRVRKNKPNQTQFPKSQNEIKLLFNKGL